MKSYVFAVIQSDVTVQGYGENEGSFEEGEHLQILFIDESDKSDQRLFLDRSPSSMYKS